MSKVNNNKNHYYYIFDYIDSIYKDLEFLSFTYLLNNDDVRPKFEN